MSRESMHTRVDRRVERIKKRAEKVHRKIDSGKIGGEEDRLWLDQWAKGYGLDICCGDMVIGDAFGVDGIHHMLGADYCIQGDELTNQGRDEVDFIVTNYFEAFPNVLKTLNEWYRVLKPGGALAFVVADIETRNPLNNKHRVNVFTPETLRHYMGRVGFEVIEITRTTEGFGSYRVAVRKPC